MAWVALALALAGMGLAKSIWTGTRLGPVVGAIAAAAVLLEAVRSLIGLLDAGFGLGDDELVGPFVVALLCTAALVLLGASLITWLRRLGSA